MSFINNLALWLISKKESPKANKQFMNWNQLSHVLIIAYDDQLGKLHEFINTCKKDAIKVKVAVIYNGKSDQAPNIEFDHILFNKKQFNILGLPKEESIKTLNSDSWDAIINLGNEEQIKSLALSKLIAAKCKISYFQHSIFDLSIDSDKTSTMDYFFKQVVVYLKMIKSTL